METLADTGTLIAYAGTYWTILTKWLAEYAFVVGNLTQLALIGVTFLVAKFTAPRLVSWAEKANVGHRFQKQVAVALWVISPLMLPVIWLIMLWLGVFAAARMEWPHRLTESVVSLVTAWVIIRLMASVVVHSAWVKAITVVAWAVAALNITGLLGGVMEFLDALAVNIGTFRLSLLGLIKGLMALAVFLWAAGAASRLAERRIGSVRDLSPSAQVLFGKLLRIGLFTAAVLLGLNSVGIDLTAFAVFTGAVGLGIGFGLQKVFSNLISGVILLLDKSVKPGDVIAIGQTYGWINSLGARYVSVVTRDGIEHLIPNEELISQRVENWSYSHKLVRLRLPFGISYTSDPRKAIDLAVSVSSSHPRVLSDPEPVCHCKGFGESSVDMELRVWINDPQNGTGSVRSALLLQLWDSFHANGIEFPYPQRDIHIKSVAPLEIRPDPTP